MNLGEVCCREVVIARAEESLRSAAQSMREQGVGSVVVCEDRGAQRMPVGILTDRDVLLALLQPGVQLNGTFIGEVMTKDPLVLHDAESIEQAVYRMRANAVRRAPVVNAAGSLLGIVSVDDLLDVLAEQLHDIAGLVGRQVKQHRAAASAA